jgi:nitrogenase molybdenum-iron protein alpha/beta subunit
MWRVHPFVYDMTRLTLVNDENMARVLCSSLFHFAFVFGSENEKERNKKEKRSSITVKLEIL